MSRNKKIIITLLGVVLVFVVVPFVIYFAVSRAQSSGTSSATNTIIIDNQNSFSSGVDPQVFKALAQAAYTATAFNIKNPAKTYHGVIRGSTFNNSRLSNVSFILDIPSLKISWALSQALDADGAPQSDASATCVTKDQAIYPLLSTCIDQGTGGTTPAQAKLLDIAKILPLTGPSYSAVLGSTPDAAGNYPIVITFYTDTGKQDALSAIQVLGYDPSKYTIDYIDGTSSP